MEEYRIYRDILCIDLKSFYASVECVLRGLDPFKTPLVVADESRGGGSIILAVTPFLKKQGIPGRLRLFELPKVKNLIIAKPRMNEYLKFSSEIIGIYLNYVSKEDLHIYSVDEAFLDVTHYLSYYKKSAKELAQTILSDVLAKTKIPATCGIGDNLLLSKLALDLESKKVKSQIAEWRTRDIAEKIWPIKPLSKMWGIGSRMERRLNMLGLYSGYDLAHANIKTLKREFGIIGEELFYHANGIDMSIIHEKHIHAKPVMKSVGLGQTLFEDYTGPMIIQVLLEMADEVAEKLRFVRKEAKTIHLTIGYSKETGGGFSRQVTLDYATNHPKTILKACLELFDSFYEDMPIRSVSIRATKLEAYKPFEQLNLFDQVAIKQKDQAFYETLDQIKRRFGKTSVARLSSYFEHGTMLKRADLVGGHHG